MNIAASDEHRFVAQVLANPINHAILIAWPQLALPDGWLVAGCLFQTVWNLSSGRPAEEGIKDYDIFYFDGDDLSEAAEAAVQALVDRALGHLGVNIEVKNQARVHLWYPEHFGHPYPRLRRTQDGIDRFLVPATCVAVRPAKGSVEVYAPHGLDGLYAGVLTPNPLTDHRDLFRAKAASYQTRWPWLRIEEAATGAR
ncbi:nucleotidyltransferase family protein [uncultured Hydrogenophaga sp.]|uniref:nucleotidyltransferase family protein n=1 Tax=uncultured Hydrogenophaga sp. TaxID=199683 RepID=UPI00258A8932|nr:nucleotidyltransferase family protein [uncultured Hydrogenophaga sp.]